jgi:hypothetical protein
MVEQAKVVEVWFCTSLRVFRRPPDFSWWLANFSPVTEVRGFLW